MKKLLFIMLAIMPMIFTSCSSDDDESTLPFDVSTIVGTWEITEVDGTSEWSWIGRGRLLTFNSDGTCETDFSMENSYKIEGGQIKTYYRQTGEPMLVYTLLSKESETLRVKVNGTLDESNLSVIVQMKRK